MLKKKTIEPIIYTAIALIAVFGYFSTVKSLNTTNTGFRATSTEQVIVDAHGTCAEIDNQSGLDYFVPTRTALEWQAFRDNLPGSVATNTCGVCAGTINQLWAYTSAPAQTYMWSFIGSASAIYSSVAYDNGGFYMGG